MASLERKKRVGILGGTFDPVHNGHLALARTARAKLCLDKVIFIPARVPPHKHRPDITAAPLRCRMLKLALAGKKHFMVSRIEIDAARTSYSVETMRRLTRRRPNTEFYFIVGSDALPELDSWKNIEELFSLCRFVVAMRPGRAAYNLPDKAVLIEGDFPDISSSRVRRMVRSGMTARQMVPPEVWRFIVRKGLYADT